MKPTGPLASALPVMLALAACTSAPRTYDHAAAADRAVCRQRVEEVYNKQNPADIYRSDTYVGETRDAPFATSGLGSQPSAGLSSRYVQATMLDDCLRSKSGNVGASPAEPAPPAE